MNRRERIDPALLVQLSQKYFPSAIYAATEAFMLIKEADPMTEPDRFQWAVTVVAAYRAGRLSMWRDMTRLKARDPKTPAASYRRALHHLTDQIKGADCLKRLYDLAQYLWREGS